MEKTLREYVCDTSCSSKEDIVLLTSNYISSKTDNTEEEVFLQKIESVLKTSFDFVDEFHRVEIGTIVGKSNFLKLIPDNLSLQITEQGHKCIEKLENGTGGSKTIENLESFPISKKKEQLEKYQSQKVRELENKKLEIIEENYRVYNELQPPEAKLLLDNLQNDLEDINTDLIDQNKITAVEQKVRDYIQSRISQEVSVKIDKNY